MTAPFTPRPDVDRITGRRRLRRNRRTDWARRLVRETRLTVDDLIWPIFVVAGENRREPISAMPGIERLSADLAAREAERGAKLGIPAIALFPYVDMGLRDQTGSEILNPDNLMCRATRAIKAAVPNIGVITDAALDPFTSHGHDGILRNGTIVNDESVARDRQGRCPAGGGRRRRDRALRHDGRKDRRDPRGARRRRTSDIPIMSYTAKYASAFYGPYREAIGTDQTLKGDKLTY